MTTSQEFANRTRNIFQVSQGRRLGYAEYGSPQGNPLFYFHGWPSSRIEFGGLNGDAIASRLNLRVDRSGSPRLWIIGVPTPSPLHRLATGYLQPGKPPGIRAICRHELFGGEPVHSRLRLCAFRAIDSGGDRKRRRSTIQRSRCD